MRLKRVALLCGHHGMGTGAVANGVDEFQENVYCCAATMMKLASEDYDVMIVCDDKVYERDDMYKDWGPDIVISIHHNAFTDPAFHGSEICYHGDKSKELALAIEPYLQDELGLRWRGLKRRPGLVVLKDALALDIPAVLVEGGFLTNESDVAHIQHPSWPNRVATALYGGVTAYFAAHPTASGGSLP